MYTIMSVKKLVLSSFLTLQLAPLFNKIPQKYDFNLKPTNTKPKSCLIIIKYPIIVLMKKYPMTIIYLYYKYLY